MSTEADAAGLEAEAEAAVETEEEVAGGGECPRPRVALGERDPCFFVMVACVCVVVGWLVGGRWRET